MSRRSPSPSVASTPTPPVPAKPTNPGDELKLVRPLLQPELKVGDIYYVLSRQWWLQWCSYVGIDPDELEEGKGGGSSPGAIQNNALLLPGSSAAELKKDMSEHVDYELIPEKAYRMYESWYGHNDGSPIFRRVTIGVGLRAEARLELYPTFLTLFFVAANGDISDRKETSAFSGQSSLEKIISERAPSATTEGRAWLKLASSAAPAPNGDAQPSSPSPTPSTSNGSNGTSGQWKLLDTTEMKTKLELHDFPSCTEVLLEYKGADGWLRKEPVKKDWRQFEINDVIDACDKQNNWYMATVRYVNADKIQVHFINWSAKWDEWIPTNSERLLPKNTKTTGPYQPKSGGDDATQGPLGFGARNEPGRPPSKGAVGLRNLGNTCFMNSTLQCLSNTPGLTDYFLEKKHIPQINRENPLGWGGKVADAYGDLLSEIWSGNYSTVAPRTFKQVIGEFQPRFSGYAQHDSSELLSFLLDGLHEDLNLVKKKPPTTPVDSKGRPDEEVAIESWERHQMRNKSIIVDKCQGQLKSRVVCPDCKRDSVTFDPFMFLSVPLPNSNDKLQEVIYVQSAGGNVAENVPRVYGLKVPKNGSNSDLKLALCRLLGNTTTKPSSLLVAEVYSNKIFKVYAWDAAIGKIGPKDEIWVYDVPALAFNETPAGNGNGNGAAATATGNDGKEVTKTEQWISIQITHQITDKKKKVYRTWGVPQVVALAESKIRTMAVAELRQTIRDCITPFLQGGWRADEQDHDLYAIHLMDKPGKEAILEIARDGIVDLTTKTGVRGFSFCLIWEESVANKRWWNGKPVRHPSADPVSSERTKAGSSIYDCMDAFSQEEVLRKSEAWYCSACKEHKCATKKFDLWKLPEVLIIHLKRFNYNRQFRDKLDTLIDFPIIDLNIADWVVNPKEKKNARYDLYAVSNHFGGLGGGHYTAVAKNLVDDRWYNLDDSSVSECNASRAISPAAYVLFYRRKARVGLGSANGNGTAVATSIPPSVSSRGNGNANGSTSSATSSSSSSTEAAPSAATAPVPKDEPTSTS